eukprot:CAMPEP_0198319430 /NCGR_PEP_ID=MMETSP1450-20131203/8561_1 /TAXON_ID=753684 ORGANISM="Madagascaria erythrocladiodes, Strain CCMP3234" /NCGR_SAMPLE_ID=MMETSP1450 /ASSEMBLY_ACC=CAM_ASM_001115 /LENGTH=91 /DNA_ID=CAMNT_0044022805 /DNA_START=12 /DNA_END=283 /DNA_ORIENTATION=+
MVSKRGLGSGFCDALTGPSLFAGAWAIAIRKLTTYGAEHAARGTSVWTRSAAPCHARQIESSGKATFPKRLSVSSISQFLEETFGFLVILG